MQAEKQVLVAGRLDATLNTQPNGGVDASILDNIKSKTNNYKSLLDLILFYILFLHFT